MPKTDVPQFSIVGIAQDFRTWFLKEELCAGNADQMVRRFEKLTQKQKAQILRGANIMSLWITDAVCDHNPDRARVRVPGITIDYAVVLED